MIHSPSKQPMVSTKTREELLHENATLKETLDHLSKRLDLLTKERQRDRDAMRGSVSLFARDVRKQAERVMAQSVANLTDARRNVPINPLPTSLSAGIVEDASFQTPTQKRILDLQEELKISRAEVEKQVGLAMVSYYDSHSMLTLPIIDRLRTAIQNPIRRPSEGHSRKAQSEGDRIGSRSCRNKWCCRHPDCCGKKRRRDCICTIGKLNRVAQSRRQYCIADKRTRQHDIRDGLNVTCLQAPL